MMRFRTNSITLLLVLALMLSVFPVPAALAENIKGEAYILKGESFTLPMTVSGEAVIWDEGEVDTSAAEKKVYTGQTVSGTAVEYTVNVGILKYKAYTNFEEVELSDALPTSLPSGTGGWKLAASGDAQSVYYDLTDDNSNKALSFNGYQEGYTRYELSDVVSGNVKVDFKIKFQSTLEIFSPTAIRIFNNKGKDIASLAMQYTKTGYKIRTIAYSAAEGKVINNSWLDLQGEDWLDISLIFNPASKTYTVYEGESLITEANYYYKEKSDAADDEKNVEFKSFGYAHRNPSDTVTKAFIDEFAVTDLSETVVMYYGTPENTKEYSIEQGAQAPVIYAMVPFVYENGEPAGYKEPVRAKYSFNTNYVGNFALGGKLEKIDTPVPINICVFKKDEAVNADFEEYTEQQVGLKPSVSSPIMRIDAGDITIEWEDDTAKDNKVLQYTNSNGWVRLGPPAVSEGKTDISLRVFINQSEDGADISDFTQLSIQVIGSGGVLIESWITHETRAGNANYGKMKFNVRDGSAPATADAVLYGGVTPGEWIELRFSIDMGTGYYDLYYNNKIKLGGRQVNNYSPTAGVSYINLADRSSAAGYTPDTVFWFDDIKFERYLTVKSVEDITATAFIGEEFVLPETVPSLLTDNITKSELPVIWNGIIDTGKAETQTITGSVLGFDASVKLTVQIQSCPYAIKDMGFANRDGYTVFGIEDEGFIDTIDARLVANTSTAAKVYAKVFDGDGSLIQTLTGSDIAFDDTWKQGDVRKISFGENTINLGGADKNKCKVIVYVESGEGEEYAIPYAFTNKQLTESVSVYVAGDSTSARYTYPSRPKSGWAEMLPYYFTSDVTVVNKGSGGRSAKSFIAEGRLEDILTSAKENDYLIIQFGHNDRPTTGDNPEYAEKRSTPEEYKEYLREYINAARAKGIIPILATSIVEATYTGGVLSENNAKIVYQLGEYAAAMRSVAKALKVPLIDTYQKTKDFFNRIGDPGYQEYYLFSDANHYLTSPLRDTTHLQEKGARVVAEMIANGLEEIGAPVSAYRRNPVQNFDRVEISEMEDFDDYSAGDIGKQVWKMPFSLIESSPGFTVEYENGSSGNKIGKMTDTKARSIFFNNKLPGGKSEYSIDFKVGDTPGDKITMQVYSQYHLMAWLELASNSTGRYRLDYRHSADGVSTGSTSSVNVVSAVFANQDGADVTAIESGTWYNLRLVFDENAKTYDIYFNNFQVAIAAPYVQRNAEPTQAQINADADIDNIRFRPYKAYFIPSNESAVLYLDNVCFTDYMLNGTPDKIVAGIYKGEDYEMPSRAAMRMSDGHTPGSAPVVWEGIVNTAVTGKQTIYGNVEGFAEKAILEVNVVEDPFELDGFILEDSRGNTVYSLTNGGKITGIRVKKYTGDKVNGRVFVAVYDKSTNTMLGGKAFATSGDGSWEIDTVKTFTPDIPLELDNMENCIVKAFVMENFNLRPIAVSSKVTGSVSDHVTIYLAGDSTVAQYKENQRPQMGWGEVLGDCFSSHVTVINKSVGSRSTKSYYDEGRLHEILNMAEAGDYLLIQLGHNDTQPQRYRHTEPDTTYREYLRLYVKLAREKGMIPVLVTPVERYGFVGDEMKSRHGKYPEAMTEAAKELNVPLIDLCAKSNEFFSSIGAEASREYFMLDNCADVNCGHAVCEANRQSGSSGNLDYTHFTEKGAVKLAQLVMEAMREIKLPFMKYEKVD